MTLQELLHKQMRDFNRGNWEGWKECQRAIDAIVADLQTVTDSTGAHAASEAAAAVQP